MSIILFQCCVFLLYFLQFTFCLHEFLSILLLNICLLLFKSFKIMLKFILFSLDFIIALSKSLIFFLKLLFLLIIFNLKGCLFFKLFSQFFMMISLLLLFVIPHLWLMCFIALTQLFLKLMDPFLMESIFLLFESSLFLQLSTNIQKLSINFHVLNSLLLDFFIHDFLLSCYLFFSDLDCFFLFLKIFLLIFAHLV